MGCKGRTNGQINDRKLQKNYNAEPLIVFVKSSRSTHQKKQKHPIRMLSAVAWISSDQRDSPAQGQAQRQGSRGVLAVGGSGKQIMINWLTFYKTLALMHLGWPCPLARRPSCFNSSGEPFVIYENQAVALIAQLQSGSSVVAASGGEAGAQ